MAAKKKMTKTKPKLLKLTEDDHRMLGELAAYTNMNGSTWIRSVIAKEHRKIAPQKGKR